MPVNNNVDIDIYHKYSHDAQERFEEMMTSALGPRGGVDKASDKEITDKMMGSSFGLADDDKELIYTRHDKYLDTDGHLNFGRLSSQKEIRKNRKQVRQEVARRIDLAFGNDLANVRSWTSIFNPTLGQYLVDRAAPQGWFSNTKIDEEAMEKIAKAVHAMREEMKDPTSKVSRKTDKDGTRHFRFTKSEAKQIFNRAQSERFDPEQEIGRDTRIGHLASADDDNKKRKKVTFAPLPPKDSAVTNIHPIVSAAGSPLTGAALNDRHEWQPPAETGNADKEDAASDVHSDTESVHWSKEELDEIEDIMLPSSAVADETGQRTGKELFQQAEQLFYGTNSTPIDYRQASYLFSKAYERTDDSELRAASMYHQGIIAYKGLGDIEQNYDEARKMFEISIQDSSNKQQNISAQKFLGEICLYGKGSADIDYDAARKSFEIAVKETNNPKERAAAQSYLGLMEYHGYGATSQNLENAHELFAQADIDEADPETRARVKCYLGLHHFYGSGGVKQDFKKAFELLVEANTKNADPYTRAKTGYPLQKFAEAGVVDFDSDFDTVHERLNTDEIDPKTRDLHEKYYFAEILLEEISTAEPDDDKAKKIFEEVAAADDASPTLKACANYQLGIIAYNGYGTSEVDHHRALDYFDKANAEGVDEDVRSMAQYYLGKIYCYGAPDVKPDLELTRKYLSHASQYHPDPAIRAIASLNLGMVHYHKDAHGILDYNEALKHFENANVDGAKNHTRAAALQYLGDIYFYRRGDLSLKDPSATYSDARYMFNQALSISEGMPKVQASAKYHLACMLERGLGASMKDPIKARKLFAEVVAIADAPKDLVADAQKHIQSIDEQAVQVS